METLIKKIGDWPYKISYIAAFSLLSVLTLLLYLPTLNYGFVFDDYPTILEYPHMHTSGWLPMFFSSSRWVTRVLHRVGFVLAGMQPIGFRAVNLAVHLATGLLVFMLVATLCQQLKQNWFAQRARLIAFLAAALFLVHPVQTQTATYITQMSTEGVAGFFAVLVSLLFVQCVLSTNVAHKIGWLLSMLFTAYIGCGTKEIIVVLPGLLLLIDFLLLAQTEIPTLLRRLWLHVLVAVVMFFGFERVHMHVATVLRDAPNVELPNNRGNTITENFRVPIKPHLYRWSQPKIVGHYLRIFFWPINLCFEYSTKLVASPLSSDVVVPLLAWMLLFFLLAWFMIQRTMLPIVFGISWFLAVMLPRAIAPSQELVCDYKTYIGSVGMMLVLAIIIMYAFEVGVNFVAKVVRQQVLLGGLAAVLGIVMIASHQRNLVWSDERVFWQDVVHKSPGRARAHNNLAVAHLLKNDVTKSIHFFEKAIALDACYGEPHVNLALVYERLGNRQKAAHHYEYAILSGEQHHQLYYNLGLFNKNGGDLKLAEKAFRHAISIRPFYPEARYELVQLLGLTNRHDQVVQVCEETFKNQATGKYPFVQLYASALFETGNTKHAKEILQQLNPQDPKTAFMLGCCLFEEKNYTHAIKYFEIAYQQDRHNTVTAYNYAQALMNTGHFEKALDVFGRCNNVVDQMPFVPYFKARCLHGLGRNTETKKLLASIVETTKHLTVRNDAKALLKTL